VILPPLVFPAVSHATYRAENQAHTLSCKLTSVLLVQNTLTYYSKMVNYGLEKFYRVEPSS